jgi:hypothetical protein
MNKANTAIAIFLIAAYAYYAGAKSQFDHEYTKNAQS